MIQLAKLLLQLRIHLPLFLILFFVLLQKALLVFVVFEQVLVKLFLVQRKSALFNLLELLLPLLFQGPNHILQELLLISLINGLGKVNLFEEAFDVFFFPLVLLVVELSLFAPLGLLL